MKALNAHFIICIAFYWHTKPVPINVTHFKINCLICWAVQIKTIIS